MALLGLVTSEGALWKKQRQLLSHALRIDILEETAVGHVHLVVVNL
jgi:hypothetical protein